MPENAVLGAEQAQLQPPCVAEAGGSKLSAVRHVTFTFCVNLTVLRSTIQWVQILSDGPQSTCASAPDAGYQKVFEALGRGRVTYACLARMSMSDCMFHVAHPTYAETIRNSSEGLPSTGHRVRGFRACDNGGISPTPQGHVVHKCVMVHAVAPFLLFRNIRHRRTFPGWMPHDHMQT